MNLTLLEKLYTQSFITVPHKPTSGFDASWEDTIFVPEKFAELIVQECAEFADEHNTEVEGVTLGVGKAIKEHFGFKE
jgi:hypothetical protein